MSRIAVATLGLAVGHLVLAGLFWLLLSVPESNVATLAVSAILVVLMVAFAAIVEGSAAHRLQPRVNDDALVSHLPAALVAFIVAACVFWAIWWATGRAARWHGVHAGEMDAWLLFHFNFTRTARLHRALDWMLTAVRYVIGLSMAAAIIASGTNEGVASLARAGGWLKRALAPRRLAAILFCWVILLWLPWIAAGWRPRRQPIALEPVFVTIKLALIYLVMNVGVALILRAQLPGTNREART